MKTLVYREGTLNDLPGLRHACLEAYGQFRNILDEAQWKNIETTLSRDDTYIQLLSMGKCFVCVADDTVAGLVFLVPHGNASAIFSNDWAYIRLLGVDPVYSGMGIGKALLNICIDAAAKAGEKMIALHTSEFHNTARRMYEKRCAA